jgi:3-oxoacyl-[acyl-carrier-protein] synthase II
MIRTDKDPREIRVVITGMGTVNPIGNTVEAYWENLLLGKSGIREAKNMDLSEYHVKIAGEIDLPVDLSEYFKEKKMTRRLDRYIVLGFIAATQALRQSGIDVDKDPTRYGSLLGTGAGGVGANFDNISKMVEGGLGAASPFYVINSIPSSGSGYFSQVWNLQGPTFSVNSACSTSNHAIGIAATLIKMGMADAFIAGGSEASANPNGAAAFGNIMALSTRNDSPETASRPFDKGRDGFVLSEGAGMVCLEELEHAKQRGAHIFAELSGFAFTSDAHDLVAPHPEAKGSSRAMDYALQYAGIEPKDVDLVNAHATSTPLGDIAETKAIHRVFKDYAKKVPVQSTKSMVGHTLGGAGGVEAITCIMEIDRGIIHHTTNQFERDPEIDLNVITDQPLETEVNHVISNGFGFGGQNSCLVFSRYNGK